MESAENYLKQKSKLQSAKNMVAEDIWDFDSGDY